MSIKINDRTGGNLEWSVAIQANTIAALQADLHRWAAKRTSEPDESDQQWSIILRTRA